MFILFEGIGGITPILSATKDKKAFPNLLFAALLFVGSISGSFGFLCYYTFGNDLNQTLITEQLPFSNPLVLILKICLLITILFQYPLTIFITNLILESVIFKKFKKRTKTRANLKNLQRSLVLLLAISISIYCKDSLFKIFALSGAFFGIINSVMVPSLCHFVLKARTDLQKMGDIALFFGAFFGTIIISFNILL